MLSGATEMPAGLCTPRARAPPTPAAAAAGCSRLSTTMRNCSMSPSSASFCSCRSQFSRGAVGWRSQRGPRRFVKPRSRHGVVRVAAWQPPPSADVDEAEEDCDYYAILGVPYTASTDEIRRAYRRLAKEFHPDVSSDDSSTEFAIFLNDVYETLSDPDKRLAYDAIVGFQVGGINPFLDTSYERDQVFVDEFTCIGCRNCHNVCSATFMMEDEWGRARVAQQGASSDAVVQEAIDTCPVSCIHWVTAPQLALLEETMSRMERVAAWLLLTSGGKGANLDVFMEAATAWEKRQAALRAEAAAQQGWAFWRQATPSTGSNMQQGAREAAGQANSTPSSSLGRGVNAATVAAAARRWRDFQRTKRNKQQRLLSAGSSAGLEASVRS